MTKPTDKGTLAKEFGTCVHRQPGKKPEIGVMPGTPAAELDEQRIGALQAFSMGSMSRDQAAPILTETTNKLIEGAKGAPACSADATITGIQLPRP